MRAAVGTWVVGVLFGFTLSRIGFSSWDSVHRMFTFEERRLLLTFGSAALVLFVGWKVVAFLAREKPRWIDRRVHPGTAAGAVLFGLGWAMSGACPSIALVQIGEGQWLALWTLGGVFVGNWLYSLVHERWFRWTPGVCGDE